MPKNWIAIATTINGNPSGSNHSGFLATQKEAEAWAEKTLNANPSVHGVSIAKLHSKAQRVTSPVQFVGVSDVAIILDEGVEEDAA